MKYLLTFLLALGSFSSVIFACSFAPLSFCHSAQEFEDDLIVTGVVSAVDNDGIDLTVLRVIRGEETKTTIRIWDGTDFDCNGPHSMEAINIGLLNDTVVVMLPKVDSMENVWDEIGDYRTPNFWTRSKILKVQNKVVKGFINGISGAPYETSIWEFDYAAFINSWILEMDCSKITDIKELEESNTVLVFPNPTTENLFIDISKATDYKIYGILGNTIFNGQLKSGRNTIILDQLNSGLYFLYVRENDTTLRIIKE